MGGNGREEVMEARVVSPPAPTEEERKPEALRVILERAGLGREPWLVWEPEFFYGWARMEVERLTDEKKWPEWARPRVKMLRAWALDRLYETILQRDPETRGELSSAYRALRSEADAFEMEKDELRNEAANKAWQLYSRYKEKMAKYEGMRPRPWIYWKLAWECFLRTAPMIGFRVDPKKKRLYIIMDWPHWYPENARLQDMGWRFYVPGYEAPARLARLELNEDEVRWLARNVARGKGTSFPSAVDELVDFIEKSNPWRKMIHDMARLKAERISRLRGAASRVGRIWRLWWGRTLPEVRRIFQKLRAELGKLRR